MKPSVLLGVVAGAASVLALTGCASGIQPGGAHPEMTFTVAATHEAVYRRAAEYVRVCHENSRRRVGVNYVGTRVLNVRGGQHELRVHQRGRPKELLEIITVVPHGQGDAQVHAVVLGERDWDQAELQALRASLISATPACRAL